VAGNTEEEEYYRSTVAEIATIDSGLAIYPSRLSGSVYLAVLGVRCSQIVVGETYLSPSLSIGWSMILRIFHFPSTGLMMNSICP
jgi:hypothetical protein